MQTTSDHVTIKIVTDDFDTPNANEEENIQGTEPCTKPDIEINSKSKLSINPKTTVERNKSSPNLLVSQPTVAITDTSVTTDEKTREQEKKKISPLSRSLSCWNLVLPLKNPKIRQQLLQAGDKTTPATNINHLKVRPKNSLTVTEKKPLRKSISSRSMISLPDGNTADQSKANIEVPKAHVRPKTATNRLGNSGSKKTMYSRETASSSDSLSSQGSATGEATSSTRPSSAVKQQNSQKSTKTSDKLSVHDSSQTQTVGKTSTQQNKLSTSNGASLQPPPLTHRHSVSNLNTKTSAPTANSNAASSTTPTAGLMRQQGKNFLAEIDSGTLNLYGQGALNCIDLQWDRSSATTATTAKFQYINFDEAIAFFPKLRVKFPKLQNFVFEETHLARFSQINALAELHQVNGRTAITVVIML